jgi:hypothetical protein
MGASQCVALFLHTKGGVMGIKSIACAVGAVAGAVVVYNSHTTPSPLMAAFGGGLIVLNAIGVLANWND